MQHLLLHYFVGCYLMYGSANISPDFAVNALRAVAMLFCCCYYLCVLFGFDICLCQEAFAQSCSVRLRSFLTHLPHENVPFVHENLELMKLPWFRLLDS